MSSLVALSYFLSVCKYYFDEKLKSRNNVLWFLWEKKLNRSWWQFSVSKGKDVNSLGRKLTRIGCLLRQRHLSFLPADLRVDCATPLTWIWLGETSPAHCSSYMGWLRFESTGTISCRHLWALWPWASGTREPCSASLWNEGNSSAWYRVSTQPMLSTLIKMLNVLSSDIIWAYFNSTMLPPSSFVILNMALWKLVFVLERCVCIFPPQNFVLRDTLCGPYQEICRFGLLLMRAGGKGKIN